MPINTVIPDIVWNHGSWDTKSNSLDDARDYIKALAPWVKEDQIEYDSEMNPIGVSGAQSVSAFSLEV